MFNIDFHIHITETIKDNNSRNNTVNDETTIANLKKLITENELCAISITDHNYFNKELFNDIKNELNEIKIFPGMEISIDKQYHALLILDDQYADYEVKLSDLSKIIKNNQDFIDSDKLIEYLNNVQKNNYILIPHWYKSKNCWNESLLTKFKNSKIDIKCLECGNIIKQKKLTKEMDEYTPVCFGDNKLFRSTEEDKYGYRVTTLDISKDDITFSKIKSALQNSKIKIFADNNEFIYWRKNESNYYFKCGLNIILGKRGSGKTQTLNLIYKALNNVDEKSPYITYIKQFEIAEKAKEQNFNDILEKESEEIKTKLYGDNIDSVIKDISDINLDATIKKINSDIDALHTVAAKQQLQKYDILSSQLYIVFENELDKFIKNIVEMQKSNLIKDIIVKYQDQLSSLLKEIETKWYDLELNIKLKKIVNDSLDKIQKKVLAKFNVPKMPNLAINLVDYVKCNEIIENNNLFFKNLEQKIETSYSGKKFKKIITKSKFENKNEMISCIGKNKGVTDDTFKYYKTGDICKFIQVLKNDKKLSSDLLKKAIINVNIKVENEFGNNLSGGERAYYILLSELNKANRGTEILLLDEIEYSFDNIFLYEEIVSKIKEMISNEITICIATHNSTIALLTDPSKVIYCDYDAANNEYQTYTGNIESKEFKNVDSSKQSINSFKTIINILESGENQYKSKKAKYDQLK